MPFVTHSGELEGKRVEIKAGWKGTIIAHADKPIPFVESTNYSEDPIWSMLRPLI
jgi:hypothetical protein